MLSLCAAESAEVDNYQTTFDVSKRAVRFVDFIKSHGRNKMIKTVSLKDSTSSTEINQTEDDATIKLAIQSKEMKEEDQIQEKESSKHSSIQETKRNDNIKTSIIKETDDDNQSKIKKTENNNQYKIKEPEDDNQSKIKEPEDDSQSKIKETDDNNQSENKKTEDNKLIYPMCLFNELSKINQKLVEDARYDAEKHFVKNILIIRE